MGHKRVLLIQVDGNLPNLALMKLSAWHKKQFDTVELRRFTKHDDEGGNNLPLETFDVVYASSIFKFSQKKLERVRENWPNAIIGGTGTDSTQTVENLIGRSEDDWEHYDYSLYPRFTASIGFTQRGCRLSCKFCVVPTKEGQPRSVNTIEDIWRSSKRNREVMPDGSLYPKHLHLLDNDFFGQPRELWEARVQEIVDGKFKVCLNQGINVRMITKEAAEALKKIDYRGAASIRAKTKAKAKARADAMKKAGADGSAVDLDEVEAEAEKNIKDFEVKRLYTAWDNLKDEGVFMSGMDKLQEAGIPAKHVMAYMLVGFAKNETLESVVYRFERMTKRGILVYPMVFDCKAKDPEYYQRLKRFQRWVVGRYYTVCELDEFDPHKAAAKARADKADKDATEPGAAQPRLIAA